MKNFISGLLFGLAAILFCADFSSAAKVDPKVFVTGYYSWAADLEAKNDAEEEGAELYSLIFLNDGSGMYAIYESILPFD